MGRRPLGADDSGRGTRRGKGVAHFRSSRQLLLMSDFPNFFDAVPSAQNALDLFKGEWSCRLPDSIGLVASTVPVRAFEDYRVEWFSRAIGGFAGKRVLELGPLEAGHT